MFRVVARLPQASRSWNLGGAKETWSIHFISGSISLVDSEEEHFLLKTE